MATGYRIDGFDLEEGHYLPIDDMLIPFEWADENDVVSPEYVLSMFSSNRYRKNGQPIKQAVGKVLIKTPSDSIMYEPYPQRPNCRAKFKVSGVSDSDERIGVKGQTPHGRLVASFTEVGEHTIDLSDDGYILVDGQKTDIYIADEISEFNYYVNNSGIRNLSFLIVGGGGGGAGSGLTYCSTGGGGGATILASYQARYYYLGFSNWRKENHNFPIRIIVGSGGNGGEAQSSGQKGGDSYLNTLPMLFSSSGGGGGNINDGSAGSGASAANSEWYHYISNGGNGGAKENNGDANTEIEGLYECYGYNKEDILSKYGVRIRNGGASSGNNYGGGGGASALADGAPANSRGAGVNGTLGAGGSGAGFTAFQTNNGGKGGDGAVYVFY